MNTLPLILMSKALLVSEPNRPRGTLVKTALWLNESKISHYLFTLISFYSILEVALRVKTAVHKKNISQNTTTLGKPTAHLREYKQR